jgi:DMSO/TMAO reductase YedYZ molybdopterin-dependent catalytic subunit
MSLGSSTGLRLTLTRREVLAALAALTLRSTSAMPQGADQTLPWADVPPIPEGTSARYTDLSKLRSLVVPNEDFFVLQHHGVPRIEAREYRLEIRSKGETLRTLSLSTLRSLPSEEIEVCFECAGNGGVGMHGLVGNARWKGVPLRALLEGAVHTTAREVAFFGADTSEERLRGNRYPSRFARSLPIEDAMVGGAIVAYEMNGEPLRPEHGFPARLVAPGWYGIAQVKWLSAIDVVERRFMGWYMAKDYVTVRGYQRSPGGAIEHHATSVGRQRLKSVITRVSRSTEPVGSRYTIQGLVWNDGSPLEAVQVSIDGGSFHDASVEPRRSPFAWASFSFPWSDPSEGRHRLVSRARDRNGEQPDAAVSSRYKATPWENDGQVTREIVLP